MKVYFFYCVFVFGILFTSSCENEAITQNDRKQKNIDYTEMTTAFCVCSHQSIEISRRLKKLSSDREAMTKFLPEAGKKFNEAIECCLNEKKNFGAEELNEESLKKGLKRNCPQMPNQLIQEIHLRLK